MLPTEKIVPCAEMYTDMSGRAPDPASCSTEDLKKAHNAADVYNYKNGQPMLADVIGNDNVPYVVPCPTVKELAENAVNFKLENEHVDRGEVLGQCKANYIAASHPVKEQSQHILH